MISLKFQEQYIVLQIKPALLVRENNPDDFIVTLHGGYMEGGVAFIDMREICKTIQKKPSFVVSVKSGPSSAMNLAALTLPQIEA